MKILKGNLVSAPALGKLEIIEHGCLVLHDDGSIQGVEKAVPQNADAEVIDYGDSLIMPSFVDMHLRAPQYPMLGMGMDLPLIDWLNTYTFKTEARFEDSDYARRIYKKLASDLITSGTTRVCMFSSLHTDATLILMEELEKAGVTGYVGKVNMDRNGSPELQETTEQSKRETLRWLDACGRFQTVKPILTPRFTPSCTDELMSWLGKLAAERGLYVQSHLSENKGEIAWVKELCPDCAQYWESYDRAGLWKDHTVMAHCVHSDEREREAMREHGVVTAHCAGSNINICSGVAPVRTLLREVGYRRRRAAGDEQGHHHVHPRVEVPPHAERRKGRISDRRGGLLPRLQRRTRVFRRARRICPRRLYPRHCRRRLRLYRGRASALGARALRARDLHDAPSQHRLRLVRGEKRRLLMKSRGEGAVLSPILENRKNFWTSY